MRLQNLNKIATTHRAIKILNKNYSPSFRFTLTSLTILLSVYHLGLNSIATFKILRKVNFWGFNFFQSDMVVYLVKLSDAGYLTKEEKKIGVDFRKYFLFSITPEGLQILNEFEKIVRRTRTDK